MARKRIVSSPMGLPFFMTVCTPNGSSLLSVTHHTFLLMQKQKRSLISFWKREKGKPFIFIEEALRYCANDSLILLLAVLTLESELLRQSRFEITFVFSSSFTLAQLSSIFYRQLFMPENSIGLFSFILHPIK